MENYPFKFKGSEGKIDLRCSKCKQHFDTVHWKYSNWNDWVDAWYKHEMTMCEHDWGNEYIELLEERLTMVFKEEHEFSDEVAFLHENTKETIIELKHIFGRENVHSMLGLIMRHKGLILFEDEEKNHTLIKDTVDMCDRIGFHNVMDGLYQTSSQFVEKYL